MNNNTYTIIFQRKSFRCYKILNTPWRCFPPPACRLLDTLCLLANKIDGPLLNPPPLLLRVVFTIPSSSFPPQKISLFQPSCPIGLPFSDFLHRSFMFLINTFSSIFFSNSRLTVIYSLFCTPGHSISFQMPPECVRNENVCQTLSGDGKLFCYLPQQPLCLNPRTLPCNCFSRNFHRPLVPRGSNVFAKGKKVFFCRRSLPPMSKTFYAFYSFLGRVSKIPDVMLCVECLRFPDPRPTFVTFNLLLFYRFLVHKSVSLPSLPSLVQPQIKILRVR